MSVLEKIQGKLTALETQRKDVLAEIQSDFPAMFKEIFSRSEKIKSIGWNQYTPYFNDGDECIFSANFDYLLINQISEDDLNDDDNFYDEQIWKAGGYIDNPNYIKAEGDLIIEFKQVLNSIPEEFFKELFGDHVTVVLESDGNITTEEYSHD